MSDILGAAGLSSLSGSSSGLAALNKQLFDLLERQKKLAQDVHRLLTDPKDGLIENSRLTCRNLDAAVVESKRPGYFRYHKASDRVRHAEESGILPSKMKEIEAVEEVIKKVKADMESARGQVAACTSPPAIATLDQWFATYKRPTTSPDGLTSTFATSTKIYGGSTHYDGFKSAGSTMKRGRLID